MPDRRVLEQARRGARQRLLKGGIDSPGLEASWLMEHICGLSRAEQIVQADQLLSPEQMTALDDLIERRLAGEPFDNIIGSREFYGLAFKISPDVLSPRPETEMIVEYILKRTKADDACHILDLGTGSGAIPIALLSRRPRFSAVAVDISQEALAIARQNAKDHQIESRISFSQGNWFEPVKDRFDFIISNPPYIPTADLKTLSPEVQNFDPELALDGGEEGLMPYRVIAGQAQEYMKPEAELVLEIGFDQGETVSNILHEAGFHAIKTYRDLAGHNRMVTAQLRPNS